MKWLKRILLSLLSILILATATLYVWSNFLIGEKYPSIPRTVELTDNPDITGEGERLAQVMGCYHGCHGADMEGDVFLEDPLLGRFAAPNLTTAFERYSTTELEAIIRQGVRPDGTSVLGMPSEGFSVMTDGHLSAILSFIQSYPKQDHDAGELRVGPLGRLGLVMGEFWVSASKVQPEPWTENDLRSPERHGEYLALNACSECHGLDLQGQEGFTPALAIVNAYSYEDFNKLMTSGIGLGDRDLGLMSKVAEYRFSHLNPEEIQALYSFLHTD